MNPARSSIVVICLISIAAAVAGCGGDSSRQKSTSTRSASPKRAVAKLRIVLVDEPHDAVPPRTIEFMCPDKTGDHEAACNRLTDHPEVLDKPRGGRMCTEIYGGPETATVIGTFNGRPVKLKFKRTDGCEIARYEAAHQLWQDTAPA